ncbi:MAG: Maf family protein [Candidatus Paceibacterota bacterium]|jgi:hypothetical protein
MESEPANINNPKKNILETTLKERALSLVQSWHNGQVFLASNSSYRKKEIENLGFKNIQALSVPDDVENKKTEDIKNNESKHGGFFDPYKTEIPLRIAHEKVDNILKHNNVPPDAMVVALDTLPMFFPYNDLSKNSLTTTMWSAKHLSKPKDETTARLAIKEMFENILLGYKRSKELLGHLSEEMDEKQQKIVSSTLSMGYLPVLVVINTGIAIRFPNSTEISTTSSHQNIRLNRVCAIEDGSSDTIDSIINEVIIAMEKSSLPLTSVSGGIDYSNPEVRKILQVEEIGFNNLDLEIEPSREDLYKGFPSKDFQDFVEREAGNLVRSES